MYDIPAAYDFSCTSVFTNMTPTDAYRGAGRPEATYAIERAMDTLAAKIGLDPLELRKRNFIQAAQFPYTAFSGLVYDSGNHLGAAEKAAEMADYAGIRARQQTQNVPGATKRLGVGLSTYFEMCGLAPSRVLASLNYGAGGWEAATVRVLPTNKVQVVTGATPHGQGHETSWSMIVADKLGVAPEDVDVLHSDTAISPLGLDTYGSRSLAVGGVAIDMACDKVIDKAKKIAAHQLECAEEDLDFAGGTFSVRGTPEQALPLAAVAFGAFTAHNLPDGMEPNLEAHVTYDPPNFSWPFGTHICVVEVDTETGAVDVLKYVAVDDCGVQINPLIVNGQVHGGVIQGLAQALFEEAVYDDGRQPAHRHAGRVPGAGGVGRAVHHHRPHRHPVAHQRAGREGHRRGRHHRRRARRHQRHRRCPVRARRHRRPHARLAAQRVEGHPGCYRRYPVIPAKFEYKRASSADEAISLVGEHGDEAKFLAGGHSLLPLMKLRLASPAVLVDIGRLSDLSYIRDGGDHLAIGALTRHRDVETSAVVKEHAPLLAHATSHVGDPQVRHRGTIGGSLAHADPAADLPATTLALGATYVAQGPNGDPGDRRGRLLPGLPGVGTGPGRAPHGDPDPEDGRRRVELPEVQPSGPGLGHRRRGRLAAQRRQRRGPGQHGLHARAGLRRERGAVRRCLGR